MQPKGLAVSLHAMQSVAQPTSSKLQGGAVWYSGISVASDVVRSTFGGMGRLQISRVESP